MKVRSAHVIGFENLVESVGGLLWFRTSRHLKLPALVRFDEHTDNRYCRDRRTFSLHVVSMIALNISWTPARHELP
jgi:hypothetical protein